MRKDMHLVVSVKKLEGNQNRDSINCDIFKKTLNNVIVAGGGDGFFQMLTFSRFKKRETKWEESNKKLFAEKWVWTFRPQKVGFW